MSALGAAVTVYFTWTLIHTDWLVLVIVTPAAAATTRKLRYHTENA